MPRRSRKTSPSPNQPTTILRWVAVDGEESHSPSAKMSDTLGHFLEPLTDDDPAADLEALRALVTIGVIVWNMGAFEMPEWAAESPFEGEPFDELRKLAATHGTPEEFLQIAEALLHRRRTIFGEDRRVIVDAEVKPQASGEYNLRCTFAMP